MSEYNRRAEKMSIDINEQYSKFLEQLKQCLDELKQYHALEKQGNLFELPCKIGDTVFLRARCKCVSNIYDKKTNAKICPFQSDCKFEKCENGNERLFETAITGIFNDGHGWYYALRDLYVEVSVLDFGRTVFRTKEEAKRILNLE